MPPRKKSAAAAGDADVSIASTSGGGAAAGAGAAAADADQSFTAQQVEANGIDQYELARSHIIKVAKAAIPDNIQLRKEVILGLLKSSTVFVNYLSAGAQERAGNRSHKTFSAQDVIAEFNSLGLPADLTAKLKKDTNAARNFTAQTRAKAKATKAKAGQAAAAASNDATAMDVDESMGGQTLGDDDEDDDVEEDEEDEEDEAAVAEAVE